MLEEENARLTAVISATKVSVEEATRVREKQHEVYVTKTLEIEEAVATVEECLTILNEFATGDVSFA